MRRNSRNKSGISPEYTSVRDAGAIIEQDGRGRYSGGYRIAHGAISTVSFLVDCIVILIVLILVFYGTYSIYDINSIYDDADAQVYETYRPEAKDTTSFEDLKAMNPDVFGWITLYGTGIDYPLCQGTSNEEYINTSAKGDFSVAGAIFLDYSNARDFSDFNSIIYGHHMDKGKMFGDLDQFGDKEYFSEHRYGNLFYGGKNHGVEIYAYLTADAYDTSVYDTKVPEDSRTAYIERMYELAKQSRDIGMSADDHMILLSTCANGATNERYLLAARITDETFDNPWGDLTQKSAGSSVPRFAQWPVNVLVMIAVLIALLLLLAVLIGRRNKKRKKTS